MKTTRNITLVSLPIALMLLGSPRLAAQQSANPTEGHIRYLCTSNWAKMLAGVDYISKQKRDRAMYMWGSRSEWKQYMELYFSPRMSKYEESEEKAEPDMEGWSYRKEAFYMTFNYNEKTLHHVMTLLAKSYILNDTLHTPNWKMLNDMKEVAGHVCMNASCTDTLRKQHVEAWFALDLPVSSGPDRFVGLPGLVLEVNINDGALLMVADKVELKPLTTELEIPKKEKGKKIDLEGYEKIFAKHISERKANEEPWFWGVRY